MDKPFEWKYVWVASVKQVVHADVKGRIEVKEPLMIFDDEDTANRWMEQADKDTGETGWYEQVSLKKMPVFTTKFFDYPNDCMEENE